MTPINNTGKKMNPVYLLPAYGRVYKNRKAMLADWHDGKDFKIQGGPYTSIRDMDKLKDMFTAGYLFTSTGMHVNQRVW